MKTILLYGQLFRRRGKSGFVCALKTGALAFACVIMCFASCAAFGWTMSPKHDDITGSTILVDSSELPDIFSKFEIYALLSE